MATKLYKAQVDISGAAANERVSQYDGVGAASPAAPPPVPKLTACSRAQCRIL